MVTAVLLLGGGLLAWHYWTGPARVAAAYLACGGDEVESVTAEDREHFDWFQKRLEDSGLRLAHEACIEEYSIESTTVDGRKAEVTLKRRAAAQAGEPAARPIDRFVRDQAPWLKRRRARVGS